MTDMDVLAAPPASIRLTPPMVLAAWRGITRAQLRTTLLLGCALLLYHIALGMLPEKSLRSGAVIFVLDQMKAFALLLAIVVADCATGKDPDRRGAYTLAIVVGAAAGAMTSVATGAIVFSLAPPARFMPITLYLYFELVMLGVTTVWVINERRRAAHGRLRMHRAELERVDAERRSLESELQAMQARVEPRFLLNTLAQVRELYRADPIRGERMLDELIAYLRAAMPKMRDTSSTLGQELELVRAYLGIVRLRLGERLAFEIDTRGEIADARMSPMMLLPLVDHAIAHGPAEPQATRSLRIRSAIANQSVRLAIADSGAGFLPASAGEAIAGIRERLAALYGNAASLTLHALDGRGTEALLEFPHESAEQGAP